MLEIDLLLKIFSVMAQISVPIVIFFAGREIAKAQYLKSVQDAWNEFNKLLLSNPENLNVGLKHFGFSWASEDEESFRKAHLGFVALNALMTVHYGAKHGLLSKSYREKNFKQILGAWMQDDQLYELSQQRGYPDDFRRICEDLRKSN